ncbi:hypothetical protein R3P38DRAFT_2774375 [Favolaschia claudopus]|uniref:Uncharacterized protein n=1 Tax=Favolaschia claudopus TaxID=2862362 RepID=A0AAW0C0Q7_9AGAR
MSCGRLVTTFTVLIYTKGNFRFYVPQQRIGNAVTAISSLTSSHVRPSAIPSLILLDFSTSLLVSHALSSTPMHAESTNLKLHAMTNVGASSDLPLQSPLHVSQDDGVLCRVVPPPPPSSTDTSRATLRRQTITRILLCFNVLHLEKESSNVSARYEIHEWITSIRFFRASIHFTRNKLGDFQELNIGDRTAGSEPVGCDADVVAHASRSQLITFLPSSVFLLVSSDFFSRLSLQQRLLQQRISYEHHRGNVPEGHDSTARALSADLGRRSQLVEGDNSRNGILSRSPPQPSPSPPGQCPLAPEFRHHRAALVAPPHSAEPNSILDPARTHHLPQRHQAVTTDAVIAVRIANIERNRGGAVERARGQRRQRTGVSLRRGFRPHRSGEREVGERQASNAEPPRLCVSHICHEPRAATRLVS